MKQKGIVYNRYSITCSFLGGMLLFSFLGCVSPYQVATERALLIQENRQLEDALYMTHERLQHSIRVNEQLRDLVVDHGTGSDSVKTTNGTDIEIPRSALPGSISTEGLQPSESPPTFWETPSLSPTSPLAPPPIRSQPAIPKGVLKNNRQNQPPSLLTSLFPQNKKPVQQTQRQVQHQQSVAHSRPTPISNRSPVMQVQSPANYQNYQTGQQKGQFVGPSQGFPDLAAELNAGEFLVPDSVQFSGQGEGEYPGWTPNR